MCHLAGYIGNKNAIPLIIKSLRIQEPFIGAQATGLASIIDDKIVMDKDVGPVSYFEKTNDLRKFAANISIGHTRYAIKNLKYKETNTKEKAHPFWDSQKTFVTMHNGTIINFMDFVTPLEKKGYIFTSKSTFQDNEINQEKIDYCDSEIFSFILEEELKKTNDFTQAIKNSCQDINGHFAFVTLHPDIQDKLIIANCMQPMYIAFNKNEAFFSSFEIGLEPVKEKMQWSFKPPHNSLITLTKGNVKIEPLIENRQVPKFKLTDEEMEEIVYDIITEGINTPVNIYLYLQEHPEKVDMTKEEFETLCPNNGFTFTPILFNTVEKLVKKNKLERKLLYANEGGISKTPRYYYYKK
jgi:glucosamine 6-phosphate synthetase-like amidotransferase/phosphosugar isomerase protein